MRQDFRIKLDISRVFRDARKNSWVFIDSTKIHNVFHLADHIQKLFHVKKPFHFLSKYEDTWYYLPQDEDIRVLENNDTVIIVPGTGIVVDSLTACQESQSSRFTNGFGHPTEDKSSIVSPHKSNSDKSSELGGSLVQNISDIVPMSDVTFYQTALYETAVNNTKGSKNLDITEDTSINESTNKRKRVRKRKQKKSGENTEESDYSLTDSIDKKPKVLESVVLSSGKHIRFKGLDNDDASESNIVMDNSDIRVNYNVKSKPLVNKDLTALLNLRQSSTPLTFVHKKNKRELKPEVINQEDSKVTPEVIDELPDKEDSNLCKSTIDDETYSFKVFRMGEDYSPQISSVIIAKMLSCPSDASQCTMKILHGKDQLKDPEGKFSLPKEENEAECQDEDNVVVIDKSQLLELTKVKAIGTPA